MINSDPTKAAQELEKWAAGLEQRAQRYTELQQRLNATSATEGSPDGAVRVTVDANGVPTEISLSERTRGMDPGHLSAHIMACMKRAQAKLRQQAQELIQTIVPADDEPARQLVAQYQQRFPDPPGGSVTDPNVTREMRLGEIADGPVPEQPRRPPERSPRRAPREHDSADDGWNDQSFLS